MQPAMLKPLAEIEKEHILAVLIVMRGNRTQTAKALGISVRGLRLKLLAIAKSGVEVPRVPTQSEIYLSTLKERGYFFRKHKGRK